MGEHDPYMAIHSSEPIKVNQGRPTVAVIGAGIAGMACARLLAVHGYPVTVFEKDKEVGGRLSVLQDGHGSYDNGCQYFTVREKRFQHHVNALVDNGAVAIWPARIGSCLHGVVYKVEDDAVLYVGVPEMNAISRHLAKGIDVRRETIVSTVKRVGSQWKLFAGGKRETFDIVVSSIPAEQTAHLLKAFPVIAEGAAQVKTHPSLVVTVGFDHISDRTFDVAHFSSSPVLLATNNRTKPGRPHSEIWTIQASTEWSIANYRKPEDLIGKNLLSSFYEASGLPPVVPTFMRTHRWYYGRTDESLGKENLWDKDLWIGACGDWCSGGHVGGRVESAFFSGLNLANSIINDCASVAPAVKEMKV